MKPERSAALKSIESTTSLQKLDVKRIDAIESVFTFKPVVVVTQTELFVIPVLVFLRCAQGLFFFRNPFKAVTIHPFIIHTTYSLRVMGKP